MAKKPHHHVYVVRLSPKVLGEMRFLDANPDYVPRMPCVYVGMTGLTPERRFRNHKDGHKASGFVRDYGECLTPELYAAYNPMPYAEACEREAALAEKLRGEGYGVWQH